MRKRTWLGLGLALTLSLSAWAAPNWKTLTDAPRDINASTGHVERPIMVPYSNGKVWIAMPNNTWVVNKAGQMGADKELFNENEGARMGIWAGDSLAGKNPRAIVGEWVNNIKGITGGEWSAPKATYIAGVPVVQSTGSDVFGNYFYRVIAFNKFGVNYALAVRTPYENRWSRDLDEDITHIVTDSHLSRETVKSWGHK